MREWHVAREEETEQHMMEKETSASRCIDSGASGSDEDDDSKSERQSRDDAVHLIMGSNNFSLSRSLLLHSNQSSLSFLF